MLDRPSVAEATTRVLHTPAKTAGAPTAYVDPRMTGPTYLAPSEASPLQPTPSGGLAESTNKNGKNLLIFLAIAFLFAVVALGAMAFVFWRSNATPVASKPTTPPVTRPEIPAPPAPPNVPVPPDPAVPGDDLVYPGAEVTMEMNRKGEGGVRQLQTSDSFDKVVAWYTGKGFRVVTKVEGNAVLVGDRGTAVVNYDDGKTHIILKTGVDQ